MVKILVIAIDSQFHLEKGQDMKLDKLATIEGLLALNNQKLDKIIDLLKDIDMKLLKEFGTPQDIKRKEFTDILYKMNIRSSQRECLKELADLFNSVLEDKESETD